MGKKPDRARGDQQHFCVLSAWHFMRVFDHVMRGPVEKPSST
jgi:hypothetical protein